MKNTSRLPFFMCFLVMIGFMLIVSQQGTVYSHSSKGSHQHPHPPDNPNDDEGGPNTNDPDGSPNTDDVNPNTDDDDGGPNTDDDAVTLSDLARRVTQLENEQKNQVS